MMEMFYVSGTRMWDLIFINAESIQMALVQRRLLHSEWIYHDSLGQIFSDSSKLVLHIEDAFHSIFEYVLDYKSNNNQASCIDTYVTIWNVQKFCCWIIYQMEIASHTIICGFNVGNPSPCL